MEIGVRWTALQTLSGNCTSTANRVTTVVDDLGSRLAPLSASWTGDAFDAFQSSQAQWARATRDLGQMLGQIATALSDASQTYQKVETTSAQMFTANGPPAPSGGAGNPPPDPVSQLLGQVFGEAEAAATPNVTGGAPNFLPAGGGSGPSGPLGGDLQSAGPQGGVSPLTSGAFPALPVVGTGAGAGGPGSGVQ